jgi:ATP-binding cassette, subfamily F, member 3
MRAKDVLLEALMKYTGTVVFVSHDRYFIDNLATRVFEVGEGKVEIFPGNYEDYLWRKQGGQHETPTLDDVPDVPAKKSEPKAQNAPPHPEGGPFKPGVGLNGDSAQPSNGHGPNNAEPKKRLNPLKRKQMQDRVQELEEEIARTETEIANLETALQNFVSAEESQRQSQQLDRHKSNHAALIKEWEELGETLQASE